MIYADYNATAPVAEEVKQYLLERLDGPFANPNALHGLGQNISHAMEQCRNICADALDCYPEQIIFTSGASESISQVLFSTLAFARKNNSILTSSLEHAALKNGINFYAKKFNIDINQLAINSGGKALNFEIESPQLLATLIAAHNETGVIQDYLAFAQKMDEMQTPYLCDTTQLIGKCPFSFKKSNVDYAVVSSHKLGSLPGVGILIAKNPETLSPIIFGGGQEKSLRGGTQNYLAIECLGLVMSKLEKRVESFSKLESLKLNFEENLTSQIPGLQIIGAKEQRLSNTTLLAIPAIHGQAIQIELESHDIFVTTSSACSDNEPEISESLKAMGIEDDLGRGVIRLSFGEKTTQDDFNFINNAIIKAYQKLAIIKH
jgi:cysteine desulfurase